MPQPFNYFRFLSFFIIILFGFLALAAAWLTSQQMSMLKASVDERVKHDLDTITHLSLEPLLKSDYVTVRTFVDRWGAERQDYHLVQFVAPTGFVIAEYKNPARHEGQTISLAKDVFIGQEAVATVRVTSDYRNAELIAAQLRNRLLLGALLVTTVLGAVLWYVINKLALQPLEAMVKERTRVLDEANSSLAQEVAERKALQKELQQREKRISLLLNSMAEGVYGVDLEGKCTFCNPAALRLLGYERQEDLIGRHMHSLIHHTYPNMTPYPPEECGVYQCYREGSGCHVDDEVFWRADGSSFPVEYCIQPIMKDETLVGAVNVFSDITKRKKAEFELKQLARDWQETFDGSSAAIWILDADQRVLRSNKTAAHLFNLPPEEMIGRHCWEIAHPALGPIEQCPTRRSKESKQREALDLQMGQRWFQVTVDPVLDSNGQCAKYIHFVSDITDRIRIEQQLRQGQKMEAIGTLAGGIAHDFNNILSIIMGNSQLALLNAGDPEKVQQHLALVGKGTERARELVQQILAFSRKSLEQRLPLQISLVIKETLKMLRASIPTTIEIKQQIHSEGTVEADPTQIHQVIMNLCTNAYQAMQAKGGTLTVSLEEVELDAKQMVVAELPPGRYLKLTVSDTGVGIDPQIMDKIFEPYFTSKGKGRGTGLGLSVVHGIVMSHHGHIDVSSQTGLGTSFHVYLPITERQAVPLAGEGETASAVTGHGERILFVDDEELLCFLAESIFSEHGYQVTTFTKPLQALEEFNSRPDQFDLVMTDMTMPQLTGTELSRRIHAVRHDIPVILCTGYSSLLGREMDTSPAGITTYLTKPLSPQQLLEAVGNALETKVTG